MKRFLLYIVCISLCNYTLISASPIEPEYEGYIAINPNGHRTFTLYGAYFALKEFAKMCLHVPFMDLKKANAAAIYWCRAHHKNDAHKIWVSLIFRFKEAPIIELKHHIYKDSIEDLALFLLQKSEELHLRCIGCGKYSGYFIKTAAAQ